MSKKEKNKGLQEVAPWSIWMFDIPLDKHSRSPVGGEFSLEVHKDAKFVAVAEPRGSASATKIVCKIPSTADKSLIREHRFAVITGSSESRMRGKYIGTVTRSDRTSYVAYHIVYLGVV